MVKLWFIKTQKPFDSNHSELLMSRVQRLSAFDKSHWISLLRGKLLFLPLMHSRLRFLDLNFLMSTLSKRLDWQMQNLTAERQWHICSLRIWCKFCFCCLVVPKANKLLGTQVDALHSICWKEFIYSEHFPWNFLTCQRGLVAHQRNNFRNTQIDCHSFLFLFPSVLLSTYLDQPIHPSSYMLAYLLLSTSVMSPLILA